MHYLSWVIGHEGKGSLISYLRKKVWFFGKAVDISVEVREHYFLIFRCILLSPKASYAEIHGSGGTKQDSASIHSNGGICKLIQVESLLI